MLVLDRLFAAETPHWEYEGAARSAELGKVAARQCNRPRRPASTAINGEAFDTHLWACLCDPNYTAQTNETIINNGRHGAGQLWTRQLSGCRQHDITLQKVHCPLAERESDRGKIVCDGGAFVHADEAGNLLVLALMFTRKVKPTAHSPKCGRLCTVHDGPRLATGCASRRANGVMPNRCLLPLQRILTRACTEGVRWLVLKTPVSASGRWIQALSAAVADNNRSVQATNGRVVVDAAASLMMRRDTQK